MLLKGCLYLLLIYLSVYDFRYHQLAKRGEFSLLLIVTLLAWQELGFYNLLQRSLFNFAAIVFFSAALHGLEMLFSKFLMGGGDILYLSALCGLLPLNKFLVILPLSALLALPEAIYALIMKRSELAFIPYMSISVILLLNL